MKTEASLGSWLRPDGSGVEAVTRLELDPPGHGVSYIAIPVRHAFALTGYDFTPLHPESIGVRAFARQIVKSLEVANRGWVRGCTDRDGSHKTWFFILVDVDRPVTEAHSNFDVLEIRHSAVFHCHTGRLLSRFAGTGRKKGNCGTKSQSQKGSKPEIEELFHDETGKFTPSREMSESSILFVDMKK